MRGEGPLVVLFDGECGFCRWAVAHLRRWDDDPADGRRRFELRPLQEAAADPGLRALTDGFDLGDALTVVDRTGGRTARGGDAVLAIAVRLPGGRALRPWLRIAPFRLAVRALYGAAASARPALAALGMRR